MRIEQEEEGEEGKGETAEATCKKTSDVWGLCTGNEYLCFCVGADEAEIDNHYKVVMTQRLYELIRGKNYYSNIPYDEEDYPFDGVFQPLSVAEYETIHKFDVECGREIIDRVIEHQDHADDVPEDWFDQVGVEWKKECVVQAIDEEETGIGAKAKAEAKAKAKAEAEAEAETDK